MRILRRSFQQLLSYLRKNIFLLRTTPRVKYRRSRDHPASVLPWRSAEMRRRGFADDINPIVTGSSRRNARFYGSVEFNGTRITTYVMLRKRERYHSSAQGEMNQGRPARWPNDQIWSLEVAMLFIIFSFSSVVH